MPKKPAKAVGPPKLATISETVFMSLISIQSEHLSTISFSRTVNNRRPRNNSRMAQITSPPRRMPTVERSIVAQRLLFIRERLGVNKTQMAESIGMSKSNYGQVEAGNRMLTVDQMYCLFVIHGVPMEYTIAGLETNLPVQFR